MHPLIEADAALRAIREGPGPLGARPHDPAGQAGRGHLGPNGAGKTTFIAHGGDVDRARRGGARVTGHDVVRDPMAVRRMIGLAGQSAAGRGDDDGPGERGDGGPPVRPGAE